MISIIIPCYWANKELVEMTLECVKSVARYTTLPHELIIVDDGSPVPKNKNKFVDFVIRDINGGYAAAVQTGVERARGDILVILNNDTEVGPGWLEGLVEPLDEYDIMSIRTSDQTGFGTENTITEGDKFGSCWAIKRSVWDALGGLDESFGKGYFEDLDLWRRAQDAGYKIGKNHSVVIYHRGKQTFQTVDPNDSAYRHGMEQYKKKHGVVE